MSKSYTEKLKDPRWQRKRLEILEAHNWTCEWCEEQSKTLHVHHGHYDNKLQPWEYEACYLHCLCEDCHEKRHIIEDKILKSISAIRTKDVAGIWNSCLLPIAFAHSVPGIGHTR